MKLGTIKLTKNEINSSSPIGLEAPEYFDVWVELNGSVTPLRLTRRELDRATSRGGKQRSEVEPLDKSFLARLFGGK